MQPLLLEMDREMEAAAASLGAGGFTIFRRIIFPNLLPGLAAGVALAFARALGEFGSVPALRRRPAETEVSSVFIRQQIESGNDVGAAAVSVVLLAASLLLLAVVTLIQRWGSRHERGSGGGLTVMPTSGEDFTEEEEATMSSSTRQPLGPAHPRARLPDRCCCWRRW